MLACSLVERGHAITLIAHPDSATPVSRVSYTGKTSRSLADTVANAAIVARTVARGRFDIIHSFSRLAYLAPVMALNLPKLMTYQRPVTRRSIALSRILSRDTLDYAAASRKMME